MNSAGIVLPDIDALTDLPLLGPIVWYVDRAAVDVGLPLWLREFAVLALLGVLAYLALRLIARLIFR